MTPVAPLAPIAAAAPGAVEPAATFNPSDLERLRELIKSTASQTANPPGAAVAAAGIAPAGPAKPSFGDTILHGMLRFGDHYQNSMQTIETRLQQMVKTESTGLTNFSDILGLQIDVAKWSMSVMGVDNASKAGSNTIKELSRGG